MAINTRPFDNYEVLDCGGFFMTGVTNDLELEAAALLLATKNEHARKYLNDCPVTIQQAITKLGRAAMGFQEKKILIYIIKVDGLGPIGFIHVYAPDSSSGSNDWLLEYYLNEEFWGQGIMTIAVQTVLAFLNENLVESVKAVVNHDNLSSKRILQKFGFVLFSTNPSESKETYKLSLA